MNISKIIRPDKNGTHFVLNRDKDGYVIPEKCDLVQAEFDSDEDTAKAYRLSESNAMIRWRNQVSQNEELFIESASEEDKALYKRLNSLI